MRNSTRPTRLSLLTLFLAAAAVSGPAQEWTRFRGPNGAGVGQAKGIPAQWTDNDYNWKIDLPGGGHSSPVLWGNKIFLLCGDEMAGGISLVAIAAEDGKVLWRRTFPFAPFAHHRFNSFASSTPAVDADRVYIGWATPDHFNLMAFDHSGSLVWERDLGAFQSQHGGGTSPMLHGNKVILANDQDGASFLIAVEAATGKTVWKTERASAPAAYSTPCLYTPAQGKPQLIFNSQANGIAGVDPDTGKVLWEFSKAFDKRSVSSPVVASGLIIGSCGSGGGGNYVVAVRPPDSSNSEPVLAYDVRRSAPYVPTSLALNDLLFLWGDGGVVTCLHAPTGKERWQERVGGNFFGSPVLVEGRLFCVSTTGEVVVIEASDKFRELGRTKLNDKCHTTPAVAGGRLYVRTESRLFSIGGKTSAN